MRRRKWSADRVLRVMMLTSGVILGTALMGKYMAEQRPKERIVQRDAQKEWLAKGLASWIRYSFGAGEQWMGGHGGEGERQQGSVEEKLVSWFGKWSPLVCFYERRQERGEAGGETDPSYTRYMDRQRVMKESAYLYLFGDENSGVEKEDIMTEGEQGGDTLAAQGAGMTLEEMAQSTPAYHIRRQPVTGTKYVMEQLLDYDFLMQRFYSVHSSTTASREEMDVKKMLEMDFSLEKESEEPQILIYHTHSQETYADYGPGKTDATVVGVGNYLTELLRQKGYQVIHDTGQYDLINGQLDRNHAYNYALDSITGILQKNPSVQVILDIHRDGVREDLHMVSQVNGKNTAPVMFFNGMSQTPEGPIEYLQNPYKQENLAFSLQMQLDAAAYYPGFTRKIYLKGLRYNLHLRPRSALIEVGAQTNTYEEARNAMEPLAEILDMVLSGED